MLGPVQSFAFGDSFLLIPYLVKQLTEMVRQYTALQSLIGQGKISNDYLRYVNSGLDEIVGLIQTLPIQDEKVLAEVRSLQLGINKINSIYGVVPMSGEAPMQTMHDQTIAESLEMTNHTKDYAVTQEVNAEHAFQMAGRMSPKGAERLSAATNAQLLHTMTQLLKVNGQLLKLQSEQFAMMNMERKDSVNHFNRANQNIKNNLSRFSGDFNFPRFKR